MTTKLLAILAICATMLCACEEKPAEYNYSPILKEWAYFLPGSYWIYQNEATKELDSLYVTKAYEKVDSNYADGAFRSFVNKLHVIMRNSKGNSIETISESDCYFREANSAGRNRMKFNFLFTSTDNILDERYINKKYSNFEVNKVFFSEVYEYDRITEYYGFDSTQMATNSYFIAKNSWIIKMDLIKNGNLESWSLIRSKIVQ